MALLELIGFFSIILIVILVIFTIKSIKILRPYERGLIERYGKYQRTASSGITFLLPFIETLKKIDMRERVIDVPPQEVITKDNASVLVDALVYYEIFDPKLAEYNVLNFEFATTQLAQTTLRDIIGGMELDQTLISREKMNTTLTQVLDKATDKWGLRVTRVEIKKIEPPRDITDAMSKQMKAERERRAAILEAEGIKQAEILKSEGHKQAAILEAEGKAQAIQKVAEAQAQATQVIYSAIHKGMPTNDLIAIKYLETLEKMADGKATKIFLPVESSGILGSISTIGELFKKEKNEKE